MTRGYKVSLLTALYFAQGLPFGFFTQTLPVLLRDAGLSLKAISALSLLAVPWALKFLWAPFVDHRGTRRAWLLPLQLAGVMAALVLAGIDLEKGLAIVLVAAFCVQPGCGVPGHRDRRPGRRSSSRRNAVSATRSRSAPTGWA